MPFPASLTMVTLSGTFLHGDGDPRAGSVIVTLPTAIRSESDDVIVPPFDLEIDLDNAGSFSIELPATTDPDWPPNDAEYIIQAVFSGDDWRKLWWSLPLPHTSPTADLADAGAPNIGTPSATVRQGVTQPLHDGGYKGTYGAGTAYRVGDTVQHGSSVYGALKASTGVTPGTDATTWKVYPSSGGGGAVASVFGRDGDVVAATNDYSVAQISGLAAALAAKADASALTTEATTRATNDATLATAITDEATARAAADVLKAPLASPTFTGTVAGITKAMVGLGNVDNTSDASKPVSTAQQTALDGKLSLATVNAKGDLLVATANDTITRLPVGGTDGHVLTVDAAEASGVKWAAASGGGGGGLVAIRQQYITSGNPTIPSTGGGWQSLAGFSLSIPASVDDYVDIVASFLSDSDAGDMFLDFAVVVGGSRVRYMSSGTATPSGEGIMGLYPAPSLRPFNGPRGFKVESGDLDGGNVTWVLAINATGAGTIVANAGGPFYWVSRNYGDVPIS